MDREQIKRTLINMYNDNKYYMQLPKDAEITQVQFNNWIRFVEYIFGELTYIRELSQKQLYNKIKNKINDIDNTVNDIYLRLCQEAIKETQEYKTIQADIKYYYKIQNQIQDKISEIIHNKKSYTFKLINKDLVLKNLESARNKYHLLMLKHEQKAKELLNNIALYELEQYCKRCNNYVCTTACIHRINYEYNLLIDVK